MKCVPDHNKLFRRSTHFWSWGVCLRTLTPEYIAIFSCFVLITDEYQYSISYAVVFVTKPALYMHTTRLDAT